MYPPGAGMAYRLSHSSFFKNIHSEIIEPGCGFTILPKERQRPLPAPVFFHIGPTALFKFGASDERYLHLQA